MTATAIAAPVGLQGWSVTTTSTSPYRRMRFAASQAAPWSSAHAIEAYASRANSPKAHSASSRLRGSSLGGGTAMTTTASSTRPNRAAGYQTVGG